MRLLVDTNRFADLVANNRSAHERLQQASEVWRSVITIGELLAGFSQGLRQAQNERRLADLLDLQGVNVLLLGRDTPRYYSNVWKTLRAQGTKIPTNDVWIAAQALEHDLIVDTCDHHFEYIPGLKIIGMNE